MDQEKFLKEHCNFENEHDCYVLLAVSRKKDTPSITNAQEVVFREVLRKVEDIPRKLARLKLNCGSYRTEEGDKLPFYIYVTLNSRDSRKAARQMVEKVLECFYEESLGNDRSRIIKRLDREFISFLMKDTSRGKGQRYFMVDFDTKDVDKIKAFELTMSLHTEIVKKVETRNGYHYKIMPFNKTLLTKCEYYEIKTDSLMFVDYIQNG